MPANTVIIPVKAIRPSGSQFNGDVTALGEMTAGDKISSVYVSGNTQYMQVANTTSLLAGKMDVANTRALYNAVTANVISTVNVGSYMSVSNTQSLVNARLGATATVTLTGDVSGSASFSSNAVSITTTIADDSHNHTISNIDNLQTSLDAKATWLALTATNTAIRSLVTSNDTDISNLQTEDSNLWSAITATNTAIRSLVSSNDTDISNLQTEDSNLWSAITATNTAIRSITTTNANKISQVESNLLASNNAIRSYVDTEVAAVVNSAPATLDTLNELAAALNDDANFAATVTTNLGQKLGATATVTLTGDVTGSGSFSANSITIALTDTNLGNTNSYIASVDSTRNSNLANTNSYIASVDSTRNSNLANTNSYIASVSSSVANKEDAGTATAMAIALG